MPSQQLPGQQLPGQQASRPAINPVGRGPLGPPTLGGRPPAAPQRPPMDDDNSATAVHPPLPDDFADYPQAQQPPPQQPTQQQQPVQQPGMQPPTMLQQPVQRPAGVPPEANTEEFPPVPGESQAPLRPAPPGGRGGMPQGATQIVPPVGQPNQPPGRRNASQPAMESTQAHAGPFVDDDDDDYPPSGVATDPGPDEAFPSREDDYDVDDGSDRSARIDSFDDIDDEPESARREWVLMGAQVGVGAIAGAVVWLAFSWLWGAQPVLAVVAAVLVTIGLVLGVRRWRRADDLQTTVLAVLAGLVVTVSPAALLLLRH
jgi:hypothetical protein